MRLNKNYELSDLENIKYLYFEDKLYEPNIRKANELKHLYYDAKKAEEIDPETELYYIYRNLVDKEIEEIIKKEDLRIDVTVMRNILIGDEYNKTHGHYHPEASPGRTFPEIYQVLKGRVLFLLQRCEENIVDDLILIEARENETVIIPPNYGHNIANVNDGVSITLNLVSSRFIPLYHRYKKNKGAAIYVLKENKLLINNNYIINTKPRFLKTKIKNENLFYKLTKNVKEFKFLNWPYEIENYFQFFEEESRETL